MLMMCLETRKKTNGGTSGPKPPSIIDNLNKKKNRYFGSSFSL